MPAKQPLADRYGRWTVLNKDETGPTNLCQCDCGKLRHVLRHKLRNETSRSCGCLKKDRLTGTTWPNLAPENSTTIEPGSRHGRWTALTLPYSEPRGKNRVAQVRCDCGTEKTVVAGHLLNGKTKSCGCLKRDAGRAVQKI